MCSRALGVVLSSGFGRTGTVCSWSSLRSCAWSCAQSTVVLYCASAATSWLVAVRCMQMSVFAGGVCAGCSVDVRADAVKIVLLGIIPTVRITRTSVNLTLVTQPR